MSFLPSRWGVWTKATDNLEHHNSVLLFSCAKLGTKLVFWRRRQDSRMLLAFIKWLITLSGLFVIIAKAYCIHIMRSWWPLWNNFTERFWQTITARIESHNSRAHRWWLIRNFTVTCSVCTHWSRRIDNDRCPSDSVPLFAWSNFYLHLYKRSNVQKSIRVILMEEKNNFHTEKPTATQRNAFYWYAIEWEKN